MRSNNLPLHVIMATLCVVSAAKIRGAKQPPQQCTNHVTDMQFKIDDPESRQPCEDIVKSPKEKLQCRIVDAGHKDCPMCKCSTKTDRSTGVKYAGWVRDGTDAVPTDGSEVNAQFFGNVVSHAKMLCQIVEAIDCWQSKDLPKIPGLNAAQARPELLKITDVDGQVKFINAGNVMDTVKTICKVIDGGVGELPKLLPGFIGGALPGIPGLLGKVIGLLGGGGGIGGLIGRIGKGLFGAIFSTDEPGMRAAGTIQVYDSPEQAYEDAVLQAELLAATGDE